VIKAVALESCSRTIAGAPSLSMSVRITEILDYLQNQGKLAYMVIRENDISLLSTLRWANVIFISKYVSADVLNLVRQAKRQGIKIIYDIDDWVFSFPHYSAHKTKPDTDQIGAMLELADAVTVANENILRDMRSYRSDAVLLPNSMYVEKYMPAEPGGRDEESHPPRVVFLNTDFLKMIAGKDVLLRALQVFFHRHPEYILDFYGDPFPEMFSLSFLHFTQRMPYEDTLRSLSNGGYQFAITPLGGEEDSQDMLYNTYKNPFKYLNYGATRIPGIYSSSPIYRQSVIHKKTGLLIENTYENWLESMELMASDTALRQSIRANAYEDVLENHHVRFGAAVLADIFSRWQC